MILRWRSTFTPAHLPGRFVRRLIVGVVSLAVLVSGMAAYSLYRSHAEYERRAVVSTQNLSRVLAQDLAATFRKVDLAVLAVTDEIERQLASGRIDERSINEHISRQAARQPDVDSVRYADAQGNVVYGIGIGDTRINTGHREYFQQLRDTPSAGLVISKPMVGQISGKWSIVLARRVNRPDGSFDGAAYAVILLENFQKQFALLDLGTHGAVSLRDLELGTVVRHPEPQGLGTAVGNRTFSKEWPEKLKENPDFGTYFAVGLDGRNRALSFRRVADFPFYIIVGQYPADYLAEWRREALSTILLVGIFILVTCWFAWLLSQSWRLRESEARAREAERERLTLDLHDGCIQSIYSIGLHLEQVRRLIARAPEKASQAVGEAQADLNLVIQDLRAYIAGETGAINSPATFMSELERIIPQLDDMRPSFTLDIDELVVSALTPKQAAHVLRITQEAVSNIVRHANASRAVISLRRRGAEAMLEVTDDGRGIADIGPTGGLGLHHIHGRARKLGGRAHAHSPSRQGTRIVVEFPLPA